MNKNKLPEQLTMDILHRSDCRIKVGAVLKDKKGIFSWGWNHAGSDGYGCHAEVHAIMRANPKRLAGSTIYVAGLRAKNRMYVPSKPCLACEYALNIAGIRNVVWFDRNEWRH